MFTTINEFKLYMESNYQTLTNDNNIPIEKIVPNMDLVKKYADYALSLELSKPNTVSIVKNIFTDPSQAPREISVDFVINNLDSIMDYLDKVPDENYSTDDTVLSKDIDTTNDLPFECVMKITPNNDKVQKLYEQLNEKIKNDNFKVIFKDNIFYINNLDLLSERNANIVLTTLKNVNAINITEKIKWLRKI